MLYPPKTGSTSLKKCIIKSNVNFDTFDKDYHQPNTHLYLSELLDCFKITDLENYKITQIFRDPYQKFISAYYNFIRELPQEFHTKNLNLNDFVIKYEECLKSENYINCMYDEPKWVYNFITNKIHFGFTRYFVPQLKWNDINANVMYFKFDNIVKDVSKLSDYIGVNLLQFDCYNKNNIKSDEIQKFNDKSLEIIFRLYKEDINFYQKL